MQENLKHEIFEKIRSYYKQVHTPKSTTTEKIHYAGRVFDENELIRLVDASLDFWLTHGKYCDMFETQLAKYLGVRWALFVNSGSSANLLAFMALTSPLLKERRIERGDEVITLAAGFPTTVAPIVQYGAVPVFVDVDPHTANIDTTQLESAYTQRTKAVMIAHTLGNPFNIEKVKAFCDKYGLWLIEDNCDALGSEYDNQKTGTFGDIGTSSFYPPHHITTGEGGAVYTDNPLLKKIMLSMRDWGRDCWCASGSDNTCGFRFNKQFGTLPEGYDHKYIYSHFGYNLKATEMQAAVGVAQLEKIDQFTESRRKNHMYLKKQLEPLKNYFIFQETYEKSDPSWFGFLFTLQENMPFTRNELVAYLEEKGIQTRNLFAGNITRQPLFEALEEGKDYRVIGDLRHTDNLMNHAFWIGVYPGMTDEQLEYMANTIQSFCKMYNV